MFCGSIGATIEMQTLTDFHIHHTDHETECYFIGEVLSDEEMTYQAFQRFQQDRNPQHLLFLRGNYQTIVRLGDEMWFLADLGNVRPIYYTQLDGLLLFSSHLSVLYSHVQTPLNIPWFQRTLEFFGFYQETETPYQQIFVISGGWGLYFRGQVKMFQAWELDQQPTLSFAEAQKQLHEELTASVLLRCGGKKVTTDLSGGLDSSTLTWIASSRHPVKSLTVVGKEESEDVRIAKEIAKIQPNIEHHIWEPDQIPAIYSDMDQINTDIPIPFSWAVSKVKKKLHWAKENGSLHLSGEGGDSVLCADFTYLVDLFQQWRWKTLYTHIKGWAAKRRESPWSYLLGVWLMAFQLPFRPQQRHSLSSNNLANWFTFSPTSKTRKRFSHRLGIANTIDDIHYLGYVSHGIKDLADKEQVPFSVPYLDNNVLHVCMRVPLEQKMPPQELKPLIKRAFPELPACLLNRNTKGDYTPDVYAGMQQHLQWFANQFQDMYLDNMGLVNGHLFRECLDRLAMGVPVPLPEFHQTLSLEMWLRQREVK